MGTLTMALAAVLLAGSAPDGVSGETREGLILSGQWEGTCRCQADRREIRLVRGILVFEDGYLITFHLVGSRRAPTRVEWDGITFHDCTGRLEAERIIILLGKRSRPYCVRLELHRVRPRK